MATTADDLQQAAADAYQDAKNLADQALADAQEALWQAEQAVDGIEPNYGISPIPPQNIGINEARVVIPAWITAEDFTEEVKQAYADSFEGFEDNIKPQIENFLEAFFPDIADCVVSNSDEWICNTILNGVFVPADVEAAIYNRQRDRESAEMLRNEQGILDSAAIRGFEVPQGVENFTITANQQELATKMITYGRELSIHSLTFANDNTKFAIQQAVSLRTAFVNAMGDFIKIATTQQNEASDYARLVMDSKTKVFDNALNYYTAKFTEEKFRRGLDFQNLDQLLKNYEFFLKGHSTITDQEIKAATVQANTSVAAADGLFRMAAAAFATRNTMISLSTGV